MFHFVVLYFSDKTNLLFYLNKIILYLGVDRKKNKHMFILSKARPALPKPNEPKNITNITFNIVKIRD